MKKSMLNNVVIYISAFFLIYQPNFHYLIGLDNHIMTLFLVIFLVFLVMFKEKKNILYEMTKKPFCIFAVCCILATMYACIRMGFVKNNINELASFFFQGISPILYLIGALCIKSLLDGQGYDEKRKINFIINIATIQGIIALIMLMLPQFKQVAIDIYYNGESATNYYITKNRLHGICDGDYTYGLQILHGALSAVTIKYIIEYKEWKKIFNLILVFAVTILNGRTGLVVFILDLIIMGVGYLRRKNGLIKIFFSAPIVIVIAFVSINFIRENLPNAYELLMHATNDVLKTINGDTGTESSTLLSMFVLPTGFSLIFGKGFRIFGGKGQEYGYFGRSDVGYVNDLFIGGLVYSAILYGAYIYIGRYVRKTLQGRMFEKEILFYSVAMMFFANMKGEAFRQPILIIGFITIIILLIPIKKRELNE